MPTPDSAVVVPQLTPGAGRVGLDALQVATAWGTVARQRIHSVSNPTLLWDGPAIAVPAGSGYATAYPTWANNAAAGTINTLLIPRPDTNNANLNAWPDSQALYGLVINNVSTTTQITCSVESQVSFNGGAAVYANLDGASYDQASGTAVGTTGTPLKTPAGVCKLFLVQGLFLGVAARLVLSNDSTVTDGGTVTVGVQVWRI